VLDEDLALQVRLPPAMPLDLTEEVHTRADLVTIELRRVLGRLVGAGAPAPPEVVDGGEEDPVPARSVASGPGRPEA